ncbi:ABC transporter substrate-binding protein [Ignicoccus islandicus DSM 13165]|uniref:ABC transporter substrate-binding protein n=1 Tax=Ignicoccus islandicus DSM 13165 TaxID=940295 RepID=A0A0U3E8W3_9CREN|nr:substrate-binding domain-containing protein [Ignicoccus islandicus]ALU11806.1 ABC transporter substrate-binding protein [Ignicoccus islandicus DSM 13165]
MKWIATLLLTLCAAYALTVYSAGSLSVPLRETALIYQKLTGEKVLFEFSGSVEAVRKIVDLHRCPDLLFVADYSIVPKFMPYQWVVGFATNRMVIAYTKDSVGEALKKDWIGALSKLKIGISNPNLDPAGYRSLMALALASFVDQRALDLISGLSGVSIKKSNGDVTIYVYPSIRSSGNFVIRDKSVDLISLLKVGVIDVAFEYESVAVQHGLKYFPLPDCCNLAKDNENYKRVKVVLMASTPKEKVVEAKAIVYGVTIPICAPHPDKALEFFSFVLSSEGKKVFQSNGQRFLDQMIFVPPAQFKTK